ncbi:MAG: TRAP transporter small permease [Acidobacteria bacterium]|nr:MAG: TRAP transporter small permease [Acidobacteriota bacterium]
MLIAKLNASLDRVIEGFIALLFGAMVLVGGLQVFNRFVINQSLSWGEEFQRYAHIWLVFLAIPVAYNRGAHIGMQIVFNKFPGRLQKAFSILFDLIWLLLGVAIARYTLDLVTIAQNQISAGLALAMSWIYTGQLIGAFYLCVVAVRNLARHFRSDGRGN